jgi:hypothetical protein
MATNIPIIRRKPEGGEEFLLSLHVSHPAGPEGPQFEFKYDGNWVANHGLPPNFNQQVFLSAFQTLLSAFLIVCGNVVPPPPPGTPQN